MSQAITYGTEPAGKTTASYVYTRPGAAGDDVAASAPKQNGATTRGLQAAANPSGYNLSQFPRNAAQGEEIRYVAEEVTMGEARELPELNGKITSDDEFDFDESEVLFIKHIWYIPSDLTQTN